MTVAIVTGSSGLIGSEATRLLASQGFDVVGIDNNFRKYFFGNDGDTDQVMRSSIKELKNFRFEDIDIRDEVKVSKIFKYYGTDVSLIVHAAAQPSHDWAAKNPHLDFQVNAVGTLNLLECVRTYCHEAVFIYMSTNKVYGDKPNYLNYTELETRFEPDSSSASFFNGFDENLAIDQSLHSLFGVSKAAGDLLTQEYGRYFDLKTTCLRGGCLSGPKHRGAELHGFLSYLVKCAVNRLDYKVYGYKGKQVRDNLHSEDVAQAFLEIYNNPGRGEVFNLGGGRYSNISMLEAIFYLAELGYELPYSMTESERVGDHKWWITDLAKFERIYPNWRVNKNAYQIIDETIDSLSIK